MKLTHLIISIGGGQRNYAVGSPSRLIGDGFPSSLDGEREAFSYTVALSLLLGDRVGVAHWEGEAGSSKALK